MFIFLPPANEACVKMFSQVLSVILFTGGGMPPGNVPPEEGVRVSAGGGGVWYRY